MLHAGAGGGAGVERIFVERKVPSRRDACQVGDDDVLTVHHGASTDVSGDVTHHMSF
jgi:hypothetical protein